MKTAFAWLAAVVAVSVAAGPLAAAEPSHRLPTDVVPTSQSVRLEVDPAQDGYSGSTTIELMVRRPTDTFAFHAEEMALDVVRLHGPRGPMATVHAGGPRGRVDVRAAETLIPGRYTLRIEFRNAFGTRATGLYRVRSGDDWYAFTQFQADDAREAFPCWDEPSFKLPYQLTVVIPEAHVALSNTPIRSERLGDGRRTVVFRPTPPLPSYLIALAAGPLEAVPVPGTSAPARIVTVKGGSGLTGEAVRTTPPLLGALETYFGRRYPFAKLDLVAVPEFWPGAMENPGAITFREDILLVDPAGSSPAQRRRLIEINAHELAHMWFGDLVTMAWWDDLWLNESFSSWMGDKVAAQTFPALRTEVTSVLAVQAAYAADARLTTRAVRQPVAALDNLLQSADELAYQKGRAVLGMVEAWIGPETFRRGVLDYLRRHEWKNATGLDLFEALSRAAGKDVAGALSTFLDQPGVPLVTVEPLGGGRIRLSQRRLLHHGTATPAAQTWQIPVGLRFSDGRRVETRTLLLAAAVQEVDLGIQRLDWIHPNAGEVGYYRWSVPEPDALAARAGDVLGVRERVGMVGNTGALLDAGAVSGDGYLRLLALHARDPEPEVVAAVVAGLEKVRAAFVPPALGGAFAEYVRTTLRPALDRIGLLPRAGEPEAAALLRPQLLTWLGRDGRDPEVRAAAAGWTQAFLADPAALDPAVVGATLQVAAITGDRVLFDEYRRRAEAATRPADRQRFLSALGSFQDPALVEEAMRYAVAAPLRPQEMFAIPFAVGAQLEHEGRPYRWVTENYESIRARVPPMFLAFLPAAAGGCSVERVAGARAFFGAPERVVPGVEREIAKVSEAVADCAALRAREGARVAGYLGAR